MDFFRSKVVTILISFFILGVLLHLVRKRKLKEEYALLWLVMGFAGILLSSWRGLLDVFSSMAGIYDPANAFFLVSLLFLVGILIHFSVALSNATDRTRALAQEIALLSWEKEQLEERIGHLEGKVSVET